MEGVVCCATVGTYFLARAQSKSSTLAGCVALAALKEMGGEHRSLVSERLSQKFRVTSSILPEALILYFSLAAAETRKFPPLKSAILASVIAPAFKTTYHLWLHGNDDAQRRRSSSLMNELFDVQALALAFGLLDTWRRVPTLQLAHIPEFRRVSKIVDRLPQTVFRTLWSAFLAKLDLFDRMLRSVPTSLQLPLICSISAALTRLQNSLRRRLPFLNPRSEKALFALSMLSTSVALRVL